MDENFSEEIFESGTELEFCCSDSRFMPVHSTMTSTCENGEWSKIPECLRELSRSVLSLWTF